MAALYHIVDDKVNKAGELNNVLVVEKVQNQTILKYRLFLRFFYFRVLNFFVSLSWRHIAKVLLLRGFRGSAVLWLLQEAQTAAHLRRLPVSHQWYCSSLVSFVHPRLSTIKCRSKYIRCSSIRTYLFSVPCNMHKKVFGKNNIVMQVHSIF